MDEIPEWASKKAAELANASEELRSAAMDRIAELKAK